MMESNVTVSAAYQQLMYLFNRGRLKEPDENSIEPQFATVKYVTTKLQQVASSGLPPTLDGGNF